MNFTGAQDLHHPSVIFTYVSFFDTYSQEISGSVNKSTQAVKAAGSGIKQMGAVAHQKTMCMFIMNAYN